MTSGEITDEQFDATLLEICKKEGMDEIIHIPGIYELLAEYFNNDVLEIIEGEEWND